GPPPAAVDTICVFDHVEVAEKWVIVNPRPNLPLRHRAGLELGVLGCGIVVASHAGGGGDRNECEYVNLHARGLYPTFGQRASRLRAAISPSPRRLPRRRRGRELPRRGGSQTAGYIRPPERKGRGRDRASTDTECRRKRRSLVPNLPSRSPGS